VSFLPLRVEKDTHAHKAAPRAFYGRLGENIPCVKFRLLHDFSPVFCASRVLPLFPLAFCGAFACLSPQQCSYSHSRRNRRKGLPKVQPLLQPTNFRFVGEKGHGRRRFLLFHIFSSQKLVQKLLYFLTLRFFASSPFPEFIGETGNIFTTNKGR
jgi:hypothetical protein